MQQLQDEDVQHKISTKDTLPLAPQFCAKDEVCNIPTAEDTNVGAIYSDYILSRPSRDCKMTENGLTYWVENRELRRKIQSYYNDPLIDILSNCRI